MAQMIRHPGYCCIRHGNQWIVPARSIIVGREMLAALLTTQRVVLQQVTGKSHDAMLTMRACLNMSNYCAAYCIILSPVTFKQLTQFVATHQSKSLCILRYPFLVATFGRHHNTTLATSVTSA